MLPNSFSIAIPEYIFSRLESKYVILLGLIKGYKICAHLGLALRI